MNTPIGEHARELERDAVVKWLRGIANYNQSVADNENEFLGIRFSAERSVLIKRDLADRIERCNHLEGGE